MTMALVAALRIGLAALRFPPRRLRSYLARSGGSMAGAPGETSPESEATEAAEAAEAVVRLPAGATHLTISFAAAGRQRNCQRPVGEPLEKALARLRANLAPKPPRRPAGKGRGEGEQPEAQASSGAEADVVVLLDAAGAALDASLPNDVAWGQLGRVLRIGDREKPKILPSLPHHVLVIVHWGGGASWANLVPGAMRP